MSVFGLNTFSALRTPTAPLNVVAVTNIATTLSPTARVPTATRPATVASGNGACVVAAVPPERSYAKIQPLLASSGGTTTTHVIGWNVDNAGTWRPQVLASYTIVLSGTAMTIAGASLFAPVTFTKLAGDAKTYDVNAGITNGGFMLIDCCGCELIEVITLGNAIAANATIGFI